MFPVAFDYQQWWSARWLSRMFTSLAVAVALALSGGPFAGSLPAWSEPLPVDRQAVRFDAAHRDHLADRAVHPDRAVPADRVAGRDGTATGTTTASTGPAPAVPAAPAATGFPPVRPLAGSLPGSTGSRAPPVR